jgi:hypothetical protein
MRIGSTGWVTGNGWPLVGFVFALACGGADQAPAGEAASIQAVLSIERLEDVSRSETPTASAMAQFVVLPSDADVHEILDAAGLRTQLPQRAGCVEAALGDVVVHADTAARQAAAAHDGSSDVRASGPGHVPGNTGDQGRARDGWLGPHREQRFPEQLELLEAGEVSIRADDMLTRLALNLFPPSGSASGVIYTTPDQSAQPLPPATSYAISASGSETIPPLTIRGRAPDSLRDVTIGGFPLGRATTLAAGQPLDFTWTEGEAADRVYVELADAERSILCSFADDDGSGTIPGAFTARLAPESTVRASVHRVRDAVHADEPQRVDGLVLETMVRFDFELTSLLRVE